MFCCIFVYAVKNKGYFISTLKEIMTYYPKYEKCGEIIFIFPVLQVMNQIYFKILAEYLNDSF